jgi:DNA repair protein RadC
MSALVPLYKVSLVRDGSARVADRPRAGAPDGVAKLLKEVIPDDGQEHFGVLLLDVRQKVVGHLEVSVGCLTSSLVHPREVFAPAITHKAVGIIIYHNHPSGDPEPSEDDIALTRRLGAGGTLLGIQLLDHVIVGTGTDTWVSLKQRGVV